MTRASIQKNHPHNLMQNKEELIRTIIEEKLGKKVSKTQLFPTGLSHYVFDVSTDDGFYCAIRNTLI
jgi:hypothetical protein